MSGPVTDTLGARLALRYLDATEIMENIQPGVMNREIGESSLDGRLTLAWEPTQSLRANLKVSYSDYENDHPLQFNEIACSTPNTPNPSLYSPLVPLLAPDFAALAFNPQDYDCDINDQQYFYADQTPVEAAQMDRNNGGVPYSELSTTLSRLSVEWDLSDNLTLTSVTGYTEFESSEAASFSVTSEGGGFGTPFNSRETLSQEFRLASSFAGPFNFQLGAFYEDRDIYFETAQAAFGGTLALSQLYPLTGGAGGPFAAFGPTGADPVTGNTFDFSYFQNTSAEATSLFASASFDLTDRLTLEGGARWTDEDKSGKFTVPYAHSFLSGISFTVPSGSVSPDLVFEDENVSPEVSLTYAATEDINLYAAYKTGFKSGGIDTSAIPSFSTFNAITACAPDFNPDTCEVIFDSETSEGFEVGIKSQLFDRSLRLNLVGYEYVFENLQQQQFIATQTIYRTFNVGELTTRGLEADFMWLTDIDNLTVTGALAYLDAEFTEDFVSSTGSNFNGRRPRSSPEWSGNIGATYSAPLGNSGLEIGVGGNVSFQSSYFTDNVFEERIEWDSYSTMDLRVSLSPQNGPWKLSLIGNNISDELYATRTGGRPFAAPGSPPDILINQNRGRQVFLKASVRY